VKTITEIIQEIGKSYQNGDRLNQSIIIAKAVVGDCMLKGNNLDTVQAILVVAELIEDLEEKNRYFGYALDLAKPNQFNSLTAWYSIICQIKEFPPFKKEIIISDLKHAGHEDFAELAYKIFK
jgi:hypothetical protein